MALAWLLLIPGQLILDVILLTLGAYLDTALADTDNPGHPAPAIVLLMMFVAAVFTVIIPLVSIILTIVKYHSYKKVYIAYQNGEDIEESRVRRSGYSSSDGIYVDRPGQTGP